MATLADLDEIQGFAEDFLDNYEDVIAKKALYVLEKKKSYWELELWSKQDHGKLYEHWRTHQSKRKLGVGRSIILHLKRIVYEMGLTPVAAGITTQSRG